MGRPERGRLVSGLFSIPLESADSIPRSFSSSSESPSPPYYTFSSVSILACGDDAIMSRVILLSLSLSAERMSSHPLLPPFFLLFFLSSVARNRCGHISGARNHQFRARKRRVKRVWLRAYLNKHFALRTNVGRRVRACVRAFLPSLSLCVAWNCRRLFFSCSFCAVLPSYARS